MTGVFRGVDNAWRDPHAPGMARQLRAQYPAMIDVPVNARSDCESPVANPARSRRGCVKPSRWPRPIPSGSRPNIRMRNPIYSTTDIGTTTRAQEGGQTEIQSKSEGDEICMALFGTTQSADLIDLVYRITTVRAEIWKCPFQRSRAETQRPT